MEPKADKTYFDIPSFFDAEAKALQEQKAELEKSAQKDGKIETKTLSNPNWAKEFAPFADIDLNKPALAGEYKADSVFSDSGILEITYTARNPGLDVHLVSLYLKNDTVTGLRVLRSNINQVFSTRQILDYKRGGYLIDGSINILQIYETEYRINGKIVR